MALSTVLEFGQHRNAADSSRWSRAEGAALIGLILYLAGRGYPVGKERWGDQIVELEVVVPTGLGDREKALYEELRQTKRFRPRADVM